jgi:uncharacterized Zn-finger protein
VRKDKKPLSETHPELAKEADGWDPSNVSSGSHSQLMWKCKLGHNWKAPINNRARNRGCPYCSNQKVLTGYNDLATTNPSLAKEAHDWDPTIVIAGSNKKMAWKCEQQHIWKASVTNRNTGKGCPYCSNQKVLTGYNDLATTNPSLAKEAHGWDPTTVVAGSNKKMTWECEQRHIWKARIYHRVNGVSCSYCSNQKVLPGYNDLATTNPSLAKEAHGWDPTTLIAGTSKKLEWKCEDGHVWTASGNHRASSKKTNCPYCSNQKVLPGYNDLATTNPSLAKEAHGWDPTTVIAGTPKRLEWKCEESHIWTASGSNRNKGRGCPSCASHGFDPNLKAYLYFLIQPVWEIYQIGITNSPQIRLQSHKKNGFDLIDLRGPMDGQTARELEILLLKYLEKQNAKLSPDISEGKFNGYTESWTIDSYKVNNLKELIDKASEAGF